MRPSTGMAVFSSTQDTSSLADGSDTVGGRGFRPCAVRGAACPRRERGAVQSSLTREWLHIRSASHLLRTAQTDKCCKYPEANEHTTAKTPGKEASATSACQHGGNFTRRQSIGTVSYGGNCNEERTKHHALKHCRSIRVQELRQECGEEDCCLGVEQRHKKAIPEYLAQMNIAGQ